MSVLPTLLVVRGRKNPTCWKLPERLRRERKRRKLSTFVLSKTAGIGENTVRQIETKQRVPRLPLIERIANALMISPAALAFGHDATFEPAEALRCQGLAARALEARVLRDMSQREVDRRAGAAEGTIRSVETGTSPSVDTLESLAQALGVSPAWLAFGIGPMVLRRRTGSSTAPTAGP